MPSRTLTTSAKPPAALVPKPKPKKKSTPPTPDEKAPHEKPHKPGKKHAPHHDDKPGGKHLRRVYEHLGRVEALQSLANVEAVSSLVRMSQSGVDRDEARSAADLLRAAEHLSFAAAAARSGAGPALSPDLEKAVRREFRKLLEAAEDHDLTPDTTLGELLRQTVTDARSSFDTGNFRQALELARAAEALAEIDQKIALRLDQPQSKRALKS